MNLVATSDFRNPDPETIDLGADAKHKLHVHKGARFAIGGDLPIEKLSASQKKLVAELNAAGRIVDEGQKEAVKAIDAEVAADAKKAAAEVAATAKK